MLLAFKSKVESYLLKSINVDRYLPLQIDITNLCNLRCTHCYHPHHSNEGAASLQQWYEIIDQYYVLISKLKFRPFVIICGGEPLLSPQLNPILIYLLKKNIQTKLSILTNGTNLKYLSLDLMKKFYEVSFQVSVDGSNELSHNRVRGSGAFEASKTGVQKLISLGFSVNLAVVLSLRSSNEIESFYVLAKEWGVNAISFNRLIQTGVAQDLVNSGEDRPLNPVELRNTYHLILTLSAKYQVKTSSTLPLMHLLNRGIGRNGRFWEAIIVNYKGELIASSRSRLVLGDLKVSSLEDIFLNHPVFKSIRRGKIEGCGSCPDLKRCGGDRNAAYAATGNYLGMDPGCWRNNRVGA